NIVEQAFGILKKRFRILTQAPMYSLGTQVNIVVACAVLHNLIKTEGNKPEDWLVHQWDEQQDALAAARRRGRMEEEAGEDYVPAQPNADKGSSEHQDSITSKMWDQYQTVGASKLPWDHDIRVWSVWQLNNKD
ncbi:hypothetical protein M427DRAFT_98471, partial [Gonapodya prolifera JEL478]